MRDRDRGDAPRPLLTSLLAGACAGGAVAAAVVLLAGGARSPSRTVTVQETPIVPGASKPALSASEVYARAAAGVVYVNAEGVAESQSASEYLRGEGGERGTATGAGFEIDAQGTILTNWHVVANASRIAVRAEHGRTREAHVVEADPSEDLALLRVSTAGLAVHPLVLGVSAGVRVGESVLAIGNPFGLSHTLTTGVVSALDRRITSPNGVVVSDALQTDAPINPGNSGGPLLNQQGEVIGINSQIETGGSSGGSVGIAFAIPIDSAKATIAKLARRSNRR